MWQNALALVGVACPLASRLSADDAAGLGDADDPYGTIGGNGAVHTPEALAGDLRPLGAAYDFMPRHIFNLATSAFIEDHNDVKGVEVGYALLSAVIATR